MANLQPGMKITPQRSRGFQAGVANVSFSAASFASVVVNFAPAFSVAPVVVAMVSSAAGGSNGATVRATAVSATSVTIGVTLTSAQTTTITVHWIAAEPS